MGILKVRLTDEEERLLAQRSRSAGMKRASYVRQLIREQSFVTAADVLADAAKRMSNKRAFQRLGARYDDHRRTPRR